jgi:hypothetical protein
MNFQQRLGNIHRQAGWHFVSLPIEISTEIRENLKWQEEGWGRLKATAKIGNSEWETAIWLTLNTKLICFHSKLK